MIYEKKDSTIRITILSKTLSKKRVCKKILNTLERDLNTNHINIVSLSIENINYIPSPLIALILNKKNKSTAFYISSTEREAFNLLRSINVNNSYKLTYKGKIIV